MLYRCEYDSPVGMISIVCGEEAIKGLWIEGQAHFEATLSGNVLSCPAHTLLVLAKDWLDRYFGGQRPDPKELPLAPEGSDFRQRVWKILLDIPYGSSMTYGEIAKMLAVPNMSAQAVGGAVGRNPISIIIPCHRVLGTGGALTGYDGGLDKKRWLLDHEKIPYR